MPLDDYCVSETSHGLDDSDIGTSEIGMRYKTRKQINKELDTALRFDIGLWYSQQMVSIHDNHPTLYKLLRGIRMPSY